MKWANIRLQKPFYIQGKLDLIWLEIEALGHIACKQGDTVKVHIFLDYSLIEVFANNDECLSTRVYPKLEESVGVSVFAKDGSVALKTLDIWMINSI
jgi:sucrose-6-phosphate hydrolase SacC (GH32 family)